MSGNERRRHLHAVPEPQPTVCMYADLGCGPCGGPVTQTGDGRDYCMNHGSIRMGQILSPEQFHRLVGDLGVEDDE